MEDQVPPPACPIPQGFQLQASTRDPHPTPSPTSQEDPLRFLMLPVLLPLFVFPFKRIGLSEGMRGPWILTVATSGSAQCLGGCSSPVVPSLSPSFSICYEPEGLSQLCSFLLCESRLAEIWGRGQCTDKRMGCAHKGELGRDCSAILRLITLATLWSSSLYFFADPVLPQARPC